MGIVCHGGLVAISAGGVRATGSLGIKDDLDKPAFREGNMVWGRVVPDILAFCRELVVPSPKSSGQRPRRAWYH